jgi:hypothetical protein
MDYRTAGNIRGSSLSSLMTDKILSGKGVGSALSGAISDKFKARATGVKEKFDPMNIAKFMTGGSRLGPAILGKLTGRSQSDINYFAGDKKSKGSYTQIPTSMATPGEGLGGSAINVLSKMLAFMMKSREYDLKKRETAKQFIEEQKSEEQRRQNEFLKLLKEYTSFGGGTVTQVVGKEEDNLLNRVKDIIENFKKLLAPLLEFAKEVGKSGLKMLGKLIGLLTGSKLFSVLSKLSGGLSLALFSSDLNANEAEDLAEKQKMAPTISPGVRKQFSRNEIDFFVKQDKFFNDDKLKDREAGFPGADRPTLQKWLDDNPNPKSLYMPDKEKDIQRSVGRSSRRIQANQEEQFYQNERMDAGLPQTATPVNTPVAPRVAPATTTPMPETPAGNTGEKMQSVPQTPVSSRMNDAIGENQTLNLAGLGNIQTSSAPIISTNTSSVDKPDKPIPATATVRDRTLILDHVLQLSVSPV